MRFHLIKNCNKIKIKYNKPLTVFITVFNKIFYVYRLTFISHTCFIKKNCSHHHMYNLGWCNSPTLPLTLFYRRNMSK